MTLLEQVIAATKNPQISDEPLKYPFPLSADSVLSALEIDPQIQNPISSFSLLNPLTGFKLSDTDSSLIEFTSSFFKKLKRKLKNPESLSKTNLIELINPFLEKVGEIKFGGLGELEMGSDLEGYTCNLIAKFGSFVGKDVMGLVIDGCVLVENWNVLKAIIENKLVDHAKCSGLLSDLVAKTRSELVCLCVKHFRDMKGSDLWRVLKYFLSPSKDAVVSMGEVRDEWEKEALLVIKKASDKKLDGKNVGLAKETALLLMIAYDGFSSWELCLHYLVSSCVDDIVFSSAISKLNSQEMLGLVRYLGKWLRKYERFPEAGPCLEAVATWGMNTPKWVPRVEVVVKCLGLVVDEHFSLLAMHSEFHDELKAIDNVVASLASDGRLYCSLSTVMKSFKPDGRDS